MADSMKTPRGTAVYPALHRPDTKYDDNGSYKADIRLDPSKPEVKKFLAKLDAIFKEHMKRAHPKNADPSNKIALYYQEVDKESGDPTGFIILKLRIKNKISKKTGDLWDRRPAQFDAKGRPIRDPKRVGGGTEMIVSIEPYCWQHNGQKGVSLQPQAVQIIKLVEWTSQKDAAAYGFDEQDGYVEGEDDSRGRFSDESGDDDYGNDEVDASEDDDEADY